jgi:hypothetical protein
MVESTQAMVMFEVHQMTVRIGISLPDIETFASTDTGRYRSSTAAIASRDKEIRRRWRVLCLLIKAKLESIEAGITTFEAEFLANIMLPSGETVGDWARTQLVDAVYAGKMPKMLISATALPSKEVTQ